MEERFIGTITDQIMHNTLSFSYLVASNNKEKSILLYNPLFFYAPAGSPIQEGNSTPSSGEPLWFRGGK